MKRILSSFLIVTLGIGLSACGMKKQQYTGVDGDFINGTPLPDRIEGASFLGENVKRGQYQPVYFAFDSNTLNEEGKRTVQELANDMKKHFRNTVIIAGFTDSRGTGEYNRGLGERRAAAVRDALIAKGVSGARLQTVSFGSEHPADPGNNEAAWAKNRRAEFGIVK